MREESFVLSNITLYAVGRLWQKRKDTREQQKLIDLLASILLDSTEKTQCAHECRDINSKIRSGRGERERERE